jgi:hypothetical protein
MINPKLLMDYQKRWSKSFKHRMLNAHRTIYDLLEGGEKRIRRIEISC